MTKGKTVRLFFLTCLMMIISSVAFAGEKESAYDRVMRTGVLRCGYFVWAPHFSVDMKDGKKSGVYYDIVEELGKSLNLKIDWSYEYTLGQQVEALRSNKVDALCGDGPFTRSAMPFVSYSHPYFFLPAYAYARKDNKKAVSLDRLNKKDVSFTLIDGDGSAEYLQLYFPMAKPLSMPSTSDPSQLVLNVVSGKADAMLNDPFTFEAYQPEDKMVMKKVSEKPISIFPMLISVDKGQRDLLDMLNQGIDLLNDSGILEKILKKYDATGKNLILPQKRYY